MFELLIDFILLYFKEIILYFSLIAGILLLLTLFFINIYKDFLLNKLNFLLTKKFNLIIIIMLTFFLFLLLLLCVLYLVLFYYYIFNNKLDFISLLLITDVFYNNTILIIYIIFILNYILLLFWFYYIFIYKDNKFIYIFDILLFILCTFIIISIIIYNIEKADAMFDFNTKNLIFTFNLQDYKNYSYITSNMLENKELLNKALNLPYHIVTDNKEMILCYNNKNDLYNLNIFKNMNYISRNVAINNIDAYSEYINNENCKCIFLKVNYNK